MSILQKIPLKLHFNYCKNRQLFNLLADFSVDRLHIGDTWIPLPYAGPALTI